MNRPCPPGRDLPAADVWLDAVPAPPEEGLAPDLVDWINARLGHTPVGPSLDPVEGPVRLEVLDDELGQGHAREQVVFFDQKV